MEGERVQAEFNSALEYLRRINECFSLCTVARMTMNSYLWASSISSLFAELSTQMKKEEIESKKPEIQYLLSVSSNKNTRFNHINTQLYWRLFNFELWLRQIYKDSGLEMKIKPDASNILFKGGV